MQNQSMAPPGRAMQAVPSKASTSAPLQSPSPASSAGAPRSTNYTPQFSAATQMILKRIKTEPRSLGSALSSAACLTTKADIKPDTYQDARRRLIEGMNTSMTPLPVAGMTMHMPLPPRPAALAAPAASSTPGRLGSTSKMSAIQRVISGIPGPGRHHGKNTPNRGSADNKARKTKSVTVARGNSKRKRAKGLTRDGDSSSSLSDLSEPSEAETSVEPAAPSSTLTMTKSGRQVLKPTTYNPAAMDANTKKRTHYGKRTALQALCRKCTRMHSPFSNQMVFCDGCDAGWHQLCHDPWIEDDLVRDTSRSWFCSDCLAKRERPMAKKQKVGEQKAIKESWAQKPLQQKRAYLSTLSQQELLALVVQSLELHPDLPLFPGPVLEPGAEGLQQRTDANTQARKRNGGRSSAAKGRVGKKGGALMQVPGEGGNDQQENDDDFDPLSPLWPAPGKGLYSRLMPEDQDTEHLVDDEDYEAFSVILYDGKGRKVMENGMPV